MVNLRISKFSSAKNRDLIFNETFIRVRYVLLLVQSVTYLITTSMIWMKLKTQLFLQSQSSIIDRQQKDTQDGEMLIEVLMRGLGRHIQREINKYIKTLFYHALLLCIGIMLLPMLTVLIIYLFFISNFVFWSICTAALVVGLLFVCGAQAE